MALSLDARTIELPDICFTTHSWVPASTPWGAIQSATFVFAPGRSEPALLIASTASHGGMLPSRTIYDRIPEDQRAYALRWGGLAASGIGWFEEDVCWSFVVAATPELFDDETVERANRLARMAMAAWGALRK